MAPPQVAVIGCGYWGRNLVRNFHQLGALRWICDSNEEVKAAFAAQYGATRGTADPEPALRDPETAAVVIASPAEWHYRHARAALDAGKHVFVEKPLATSVADGEDLVRRARAAGRILMVGHILRYHPAVVRLQQLLEAGELGTLRYVYSNRLNIGKIRTEENILWSFAPHDISVILALLGRAPEQVVCLGGTYLSHQVADVTLSQFVFPGGVRAHIFVSWLHPFKEQRLVVVGAEKMAVFDDTAADKLVLYPHRVEWREQVPTAVRAEAEAVPLPAEEPLRAECRHFLECVRTGGQPITGGEEGLRVLRILDLCQRSLETNGQPITLKDSE
jgi:UDP-2-acetamido-3-amino-2,3-dideoxy-glucuronate N-acetyltransferase